jgi:hypothetical protein
MLGIVGATSLVVLFYGSPATSAGPAGSVIHSGVVTRQDVAPQPGSEPDTVVEPDVAVNPRNAANAVAAAHDGRFPDGGAVAISVAWTTDSGGHWHHLPVHGVTTATGGEFDRASDPVVAFGSDGTAYLSILAFDVTSCDTAVVVLRSGDGGRTWSRPLIAHRSDSCTFSDDKNWLVVDTGAHSPHRGRLYQFWTPFLFVDEAETQFIGSPQAVRWSDNKGRTWSHTVFLTPLDHGTQNSQPMIGADGSIVDTFYDFGGGGVAPDLVPGAAPEKTSGKQVRRLRAPATTAPIDASGPIQAVTSTDGGQTWSSETEITNLGGGFADGVRCCLFGADIDAMTGTMYVVWHGGVADTDPIYESFSTDGFQWSSPIQVSRGDVSGVQNVNVDVSALGGTVYVTYGRRTKPDQDGGFVRQQLAVSTDGGRSFRQPRRIGPVSALKYAAQAGGAFPGDYIGTAISATRLYVVFAVSSRPPVSSTSPFHQVIWGLTLRR